MAQAARTTSKSAEKFNGAIAVGEHDLMAQIADLKSDISAITEKLGTIKDTGLATARLHGEKAKSEGSEKAEALISDVQNQFVELQETTGKAVRDNPLQALGIAAGIGFLLAITARR